MMRKTPRAQSVSLSLFWAVLLLVLSANLAAAPLLVERVGLERGLSQLSITASLQDSRGFWWFGTQAGLNRYDGYTFQVYRRDFEDETRSIPDDYITALLEADDGRIYIGTGSRGVSVFNPITEQFSQVNAAADERKALSSSHVQDITQGPQGHIWIAADGGGIHRLDSDSGQVQRLYQKSEQANGLLSNQVTALIFDDRQRLWVGSRQGLQILEDGAFRRIPLSASVPIHVTAIKAGATGEMWVGSTAGLFRVVDAQDVRQYVQDGTRADSLAHNHVEALHCDSNGHLWVGTRNGLSRLISAEEDRFDSFHNDPLNIKSLSGSRVASILEDRDGLLWFGTWVGGLSVYNPNAAGFQVFRYNGEAPSIPDNRVRSFAQSQDGSIWVGTLGGLVKFDPESASFSEPYRHDPARVNSLSSSEVHSVIVDPHGILWLGTRNAGLNRLDPETGEITRWRYGDDKPNTIASDQILTLALDNRSRIWIGYEDRGLSIFDPATRTFDHHSINTGLHSNTIGAFFEDASGRMWVGSRGEGLAIFAPDQTPAFRYFSPARGNTSGLLHGNITGFAQDADEQIWVTTQGGGFARVLGLSEAGVLRFQAYTTNNGLPGNALGYLLFDSRGLAWISTLHGISQFDAQSETFRNFYPHDGVQAAGYYVASALKDSAGRMYFGGIDGFTQINPQLNSSEREPPKVTLLNLVLEGVTVQPEPDASGSPIAKSVDYLDRITLGFQQNDVGFEFTSLLFEVRAAVQFSYRLLGQSERWTELPVNRRFAGFTNLGAGEYRFEVRARRQSGDYGPVRTITITRQQAPWLSPLAWTLYILLMLGIAGLLLRSRFLHLQAERAAARKVQESERMLKLALTGSGSDVWIMHFTSGELRRTYTADKGDSLPSEVRSMDDLVARIHPADRNATREVFQSHIKGERENFEAVYRIENDFGEYRWAYSQGRVTEFDSNGKALALAGSTRDITQLKTAEDQLRKLNEKLESRVAERTEDLTHTNEHLRETLDQLQHAQSQLVESEKMAALGGLVAGVAHEINTPLGVAVTAASLIESQCKKLMESIEQRYGKSEQVAGYADTLNESIRFILQNLSRAAELVRSFKQVAVDQSADDIRTFQLDVYVDEILKSWQPRLKRVPHDIVNECPRDIPLTSFPGVLYQIISNLLMNSLMHAFEADEQGRIVITAEHDDSHVTVIYRDNGKGLSREIRDHIFEPFFTTKRGSGGSGLGMHIVYNLVTSALHGQIYCTSQPGEGTEVRFRIPKTMHVQA